MGNFQIKKGLRKNLFDIDGKLLITPEEGCWYITTDTHELYAYLDGAMGSVGRVTEFNGDNASIEVTDNNILKLYGFNDAPDKALSQIKVITDESGKETGRELNWVSINDLITLDGNTKTVVSIAENSALTITSEYSEETDTYTYILNVNLSNIYTKEEAQNLFLTKDEAYDDGTILAEIEKIENSLANIYTKEDSDAKFLAKEEAYDDTIIWENLNQLEIELSNVYTKEQTYSKDEVNEAISNMTHFSVEVVETLEEMLEPNVLYLVHDRDVQGSDKYNEYLVIGGIPILIGDTTTDLTNYVTIADLEAHTAAAEALYATKAEVAKKADTNLLLEYYTKNETDSKIDTIIQELEDKVNKGTTLKDYGIIDAYNKTEVYNKTEADALLNESVEATILVKNALDSYIQNLDKEIYGAEVVEGWWLENGTYAPQYDNDSRLDAVVNNLSKNNSILQGFGDENQPTTVLEAIAAAQYELSVATIDKLGGIRSANAAVDNAIQVSSEGIGTIGRVNVNTLVQTEGEELILTGGIA